MTFRYFRILQTGIYIRFITENRFSVFDAYLMVSARPSQLLTRLPRPRCRSTSPPPPPRRSAWAKAPRVEPPRPSWRYVVCPESASCPALSARQFRGSDSATHGTDNALPARRARPRSRPIASGSDSEAYHRARATRLDAIRARACDGYDPAPPSRVSARDSDSDRPPTHRDADQGTTDRTLTFPSLLPPRRSSRSAPSTNSPTPWP
jgi:hypothetical protein